ncbi:hypothetical protein ILUMI_15879, partial [Ignelater luminosus]
MKRAKLIALIIFIAVIAVTVPIANASNPYLHLIFEPKPLVSESTLIWYNSSNAKDTSYWINRLDEFLEPYTNRHESETNIVACSRGKPPKADSNLVCDVKINDWSLCVNSQAYNFNSFRGGPCIYLTIDK